MSIGQEMLKRIADGSITPSVLEQISKMDTNKLAIVLQKETFKQESENLGLSDFAATIDEIYQLEGFDGLFSKIKKGFNKLAGKIKKEAKRVTVKVKKELKRPGIWKTVGAAANFIPGVGPILGTALTAAGNTVAGIREARMAEKEAIKQYNAEEAAYYASQAAMPPQQINYTQPSPSQIQATVSSVAQLATPHVISAIKGSGLVTPTQEAAYYDYQDYRQVSPPPVQSSTGLDLNKILPLAAIPLVMMVMKG